VLSTEQTFLSPFTKDTVVISSNIYGGGGGASCEGPH